MLAGVQVNMRSALREVIEVLPFPTALASGAGPSTRSDDHPGTALMKRYITLGLGIQTHSMSSIDGDDVQRERRAEQYVRVVLARWLLLVPTPLRSREERSAWESD